MTTSTTLTRLPPSLAAGTLVVAACAEDEEPESTDTTEATDSTDEAAGPSAEEVLGEPNPASGEPVPVGLISSAEATDSVLSANWQNVEQGMTMAVDYANEYLGGIGGRPIDLVICQGGVDPAGWQDCANQMVNDEVTAVIQPFNSFGSVVVPVVTGAGIPYVVLSGASAEELTAPGAFSLTGGLPATLGGIALHAAAERLCVVRHGRHRRPRASPRRSTSSAHRCSRRSASGSSSSPPRRACPT